MPGQEEDKKPADSSAPITLKVKSLVSGYFDLHLHHDGNEVLFRMKRSTQLKKLMYAYDVHQSVEYSYFRLLFDGRRIRPEQTPDELEMQDGDEIDALPPIN